VRRSNQLIVSCKIRDVRLVSNWDNKLSFDVVEIIISENDLKDKVRIQDDKILLSNMRRVTLSQRPDSISVSRCLSRRGQ
jgi:hypothetical protein